MRTIAQRLLFVLLLVAMIGSVGLAQSTDPTQSNQGAGQDVNNAGHSTKQATKKTARKVKRGTKKGTHKASKKTREGASKMEDKTQTPPSRPQRVGIAFQACGPRGL